MNLSDQHKKVLQMLNSFPRTADEMSKFLKIDLVTCSGLFSWLSSVGYIERTGEKEVARSGRPQHLMRITHLGRTALSSANPLRKHNHEKKKAQKLLF